MPKTRFHTLLETSIHKQIKTVSDDILRGQMKDFTDYREWTGYIRGLTDALKLCDDIEGEYD